MQPEDTNPGLERVQFQLRADGVPIETPNRLRSGIHNRGYLPHVKREGAVYFVTFRLADSLPKEVLLKFLAEKAVRLRRLGAGSSAGEAEEIEREHARQIERYLDTGVGECVLRRPDIADLVVGAVRFFDNK